MMPLSLIKELSILAAKDARDHLSRGETERGVELHAHANALQEAYYDAEILTDDERDGAT